MAQKEALLQTLEQAGLTHKEAQVYMALLALGTATAYRIAEECAVKKPTVYITLEDLRKKGLALKVPHAKKQLFSPRDITEYLAEQEERLESVRRAAPQLQALGSQSPSSVYFFSGISGIRQASEHSYQQMLGKTFHSFYSNLADIDGSLERLYTQWNKKALADGIRFHILMPAGSATHNDIIELSKKHPGVEIRYANYSYPARQSIEIGDDFVRITNEHELVSTIIDDARTANAFRQIFEALWASSS